MQNGYSNKHEDLAVPAAHSIGKGLRVRAFARWDRSVQRIRRAHHVPDPISLNPAVSCRVNFGGIGHDRWRLSMAGGSGVSLPDLVTPCQPLSSFPEAATQPLPLGKPRLGI